MKDVWITQNLGSVFPAKGAQLEALSTSLHKLKAEADLIIQNYDQKAEAAAQGLSVTANLLTQIKETGYSVLMMPPANAGFFPRLAESSNKPYPDEFSAGICIMFQSPSLETTIQKYAALINVITS